MTDALDLLDWRRRIGETYADVRAAPDPEAAWHRWRDVRDTLFATHAQSPVDGESKARFSGLRYFPYDRTLRHLVGVEPIGDGAPIPIPLRDDGEMTITPRGRTRGLAEPLGGELTLYWVEGYGGGVFLPFTDATSGTETFGGGRYLLDTIKGADLGAEAGQVVLDFNFAYNPSCVYSQAWHCPLAPAENRLTAAIRAGERVFDSAAAS